MRRPNSCQRRRRLGSSRVPADEEVGVAELVVDVEAGADGGRPQGLHLGADEPLGRVVPRCAVAAASTDPRFPPVSLSEVSQLEIEISLLGPLEPIGGPADVVVGRHGLVVEREWHRGLLLPQVATEWDWDAETFLAHTCHKAGLPRDAWKHWAKVWRFEAEVFGEKHPPDAA